MSVESKRKRIIKTMERNEKEFVRVDLFDVSRVWKGGVGFAGFLPFLFVLA